MTKYNLGCGSQYLEGYLNVDFPPENHNVNHDVKADLYTDILIMEYPDCEEIRSHHFFEHFNYYEACILLYKWVNASGLKSKLIIDLPDQEALCKAYLAADIKTKMLVNRYMFGSHEHPHWAIHKNNWSEETLSYILKELGYTIIFVEKYGNYLDKQPNCGIKITAELTNKLPPQEIKNRLYEILKLYKNGDTDFENSLYDYFIKQFKKGII